MLAQLSDSDIMELYPEPELRQLTSASIGSRDALLEVLKEVRRKGYATSNAESEEA